MFRQRVMTGVVLLACSVSAAWAQSATDPDNNAERAKRLWDPQVMMKEACAGISRHYKLDASQKDFTCKLLTERVTKFLNKHEKRLWPLLWDLTEQQMKGTEPGKEAAKKIATRGFPIFEEAQAEILKAQDEFRTILNEDQKKIHDRDLKGLHAQFRHLDRRLKKWRDGKAGGSSPLRIGVGPKGTKVPPIGGPSLAAPRYTPESEWEKYVREFVVNYRLDATQKTTAMAILQDLKDHAARYRKTHQKELTEAEGMVRAAQLAKPFDKNDLEQVKKIRYYLNKPFEDWFIELKSRLDQLPTEKQRADFYARNPHLKPEQKSKPPTQKPASPGETTAKPKDAPAEPKSDPPAPKKEPAPKPQVPKGDAKPTNPG